MSDDGEWSDAERQALAGLRAPATAPPDLEARIVAELRSRRLLRSPYLRLLQTAAAAVVLMAALVSGAVIDRSLARHRVPAARFILLLYGGIEDQSRRSEYQAWARSVAAGGVDITGEELSSSGDVVWPDAAASLTADALPRGFFIIGVSSLDEARRIARTCPHLQHGGRIVIRGIVSGS